MTEADTLDTKLTNMEHHIKVFSQICGTIKTLIVKFCWLLVNTNVLIIIIFHSFLRDSEKFSLCSVNECLIYTNRKLIPKVGDITV